MKTLKNPFTTSGYVSSRYFCDRERESSELIREITNGNNVALISTRRMGKTGLILHCFHNKKIEKEYYTFFIDIYATKSLKDFVYSMSKVILNGLKPFGKKALECFWNSVKSLQAGITFDPVGNPSFNLQLGDIRTTETTLGEIFDYLERADKPCIVAIDEFQQIMSYPEKNVEALLRTHIQHLTCPVYLCRQSASCYGRNIYWNIPSFLPKRFDDVSGKHRPAKVHFVRLQTFQRRRQRHRT